MRIVGNIQSGLAPAAASPELGEHPDLRGGDIVRLQQMDEVGTRLIADASWASDARAWRSP